MAGGAALIERVDAEQQAQDERDRARAILAEPGPAPDEAASISRDAATLNVSSDIIFNSPMMRREAQATRDAQEMQGNPAVQRYIARSDPEHAAAARDDIGLMGRMEQAWNNWINPPRPPAARGLPVINAGDAYPEEPMPRPAPPGSGGDVVGNALAIEQSIREMSGNLTSADWWKRTTAETAHAAGDWLHGAWDDLATQYRVGAQQQEQSELGWKAVLYGGNSLTAAERQRLVYLNSIDQPAPKTWVGTAVQTMPMMMASIGQGAQRAWPGALEGAGIGAGFALVAGQAGPQVAAPEEIATVPGAAIVGFGLGARTGFTYGMTEKAAQMEAGGAYAEFSQMRDEFGNPMDDDVARMAALAVGGVNGLLEVAELRTVIRAMPGGEALLKGVTRARMRQLLMRRSFREALLQAAGRVLHTGVVEGVTESTQEAVTVAGRFAAANMDGRHFEQPTGPQIRDRIMSAGAFGFQAGVTFGFTGAAAGVALDIPRINRARADVALMDSLSTEAGQSKLRRRLPERFHAWVDALTENGPLDTVWVDARSFQTFFQSHDVDPYEVADALEGVGRERLQQALDARDDIAIPIATFVTKIAGTPAYEGFARENMRLHPDAATLTEARAMQAHEADIRRSMDELQAAKEFDDNELEAEQTIARDMHRRLDLAGVTVTDANRHQVQVAAAALVNLARRGNANPFDLYRRFYSDVRGPFDDTPEHKTAGNRTLEQPGQADVEAFARDVAAAHGLGDLRLSLDEKTGDLTLNTIGVAKKGQRRGAGSAAMRKIVQWADERGLRLVATPPKRGGAFGTTSQARARGFLARHGFIENKGANADATVREAMYRKPTGKALFAQAENPTGTPRIDARAVEPMRGTTKPGVLEAASAEMALAVETAHDKIEAGEPLSYLEEYALMLEAEAKGVAPETLVSQRYYSSERGDSEWRKADANGRMNLRGLLKPDEKAALDEKTPENARLKELMAEHEALAAQIEERLKSGERDLPAVQKAREDAAAMRAAAYCSARDLIRRAGAIKAVGGVIGGAIAAEGADLIAGMPTDTASNDDTPARRLAPADSAPPAAPAAPPVIQPDTADADIAALPAEQAAAVPAPEAAPSADAPAPPSEQAVGDEPIVTNNFAAREDRP